MNLTSVAIHFNKTNYLVSTEELMKVDCINVVMLDRKLIFTISCSTKSLIKCLRKILCPYFCAID